MQHRITRPIDPDTGRPERGWLAYRGHFILRALQPLEFEGMYVEWTVFSPAPPPLTFDGGVNMDVMNSRYTLRDALALIDFHHKHHLTH